VVVERNVVVMVQSYPVVLLNLLIVVNFSFYQKLVNVKFGVVLVPFSSLHGFYVYFIKVLFRVRDVFIFSQLISIF